jgi:hypothetical protein
MAKKAPKQLTHLRIRIEPKLLNRLEKSREKDGNTLTGEIVARLERSFETEDRRADFKEGMETVYKQFAEKFIEIGLQGMTGPLIAERVAEIPKSSGTEDRRADFKEGMETAYKEFIEKGLQDMTGRLIAERVAEIRGEKEEMARELSGLRKDIEKLVEQAERGASIVGVLVGDDKLKSRVLRRVALEMDSWPEDWATNPAKREEIAARFRDALAQGEVA